MQSENRSVSDGYRACRRGWVHWERAALTVSPGDTGQAAQGVIPKQLTARLVYLVSECVRVPGWFRGSEEIVANRIDVSRTGSVDCRVEITLVERRNDRLQVTASERTRVFI